MLGECAQCPMGSTRAIWAVCNHLADDDALLVRIDVQVDAVQCSILSRSEMWTDVEHFTVVAD